MCGNLFAACWPLSLQGTRLGITTVVSTDSIRHMLRSFHPRDEAPLLWASTYQAGECLDEGAGNQQAAAAGGKAQVWQHDDMVVLAAPSCM